MIFTVLNSVSITLGESESGFAVESPCLAVDCKLFGLLSFCSTAGGSHWALWTEY